VVESPGYPATRDAGDRISILEDTDGDGRADEILGHRWTVRSAAPYWVVVLLLGWETGEAFVNNNSLSSAYI